MKFSGKISISWPIDFLKLSVYKTPESCWWLLLTILKRTNTVSVISKLGTFSPFLGLVILLSLLSYFHLFWRSQFEITSRLYSKRNSVFLYIYVHSDWTIFSIFPCFLRYIQNNLEYLIQNMIRQVAQTIHSTSEMTFFVFELNFSNSLFL